MPKWTPEELAFLEKSGERFNTAALDYYARKGDLRILPLIDKIMDNPNELSSEKRHMTWTCQQLVDYYKKEGDEATAAKVEEKRQEVIRKLKEQEIN